MRKKNIVIIVLVSIIFLGISTYFAIKLINNNKANKIEEKEERDDERVEEKDKLKIIDIDSKSRPYAIMIDNIKAAFPQAGLQDAYLVYEIIVEGGQTRLLALFKDVDTSLIGPVRSARHYFIDYAMENDAYYVHHGYSPQAKRDLGLFKVNNINGLSYEGTTLWRDTKLSAPHNLFTSMKKLESRASLLKYRNEITKTTLLNYSIDEINLENEDDVKIANEVNIPYSNIHTTKYVYDNETKVYKRYSYNVQNTDKVTTEQYTTKNIIVINVKNYADLENSDGGRQTLDNVGNGKGYYITNGYAIPITYSKSSRESQTIYKKLNGEEVMVNDGNTYIQIQPTTRKTTFK